MHKKDFLLDSTSVSNCGMALRFSFSRVVNLLRGDVPYALGIPLPEAGGTRTLIHLGLGGLCMCGLTGCIVPERLSNVGEPPELSQIQDPTLVASYEPVTMPMPTPQRQTQGTNSLWQRGSRAFFKDQRAHEVGDVLTVKIDITDKAEIKNDFNTKRTTKNNSSITDLFGYEKYLRKFLPKSVDKDNLTNLTFESETDSTGNKNTQETSLTLELAATIIQQLPNGNLVVQGRQDVRLSGELRTVELRGIIRREDIMSDNSITYDKVAEARISSVSKGEISDSASVPWGQEVLNKVLPF